MSGKLKVGGAVVFWTARDGSSREKIKQGLFPMKLDLLIPELRPPQSVLRDALEMTINGRKQLVRPTKERSQFAVVDEDRGDQGNSYQTAYHAAVKVQAGDYSIAFDRPTADEPIVRGHYDRLSGYLMATQISHMLVAIIEKMGGTRLRPSGSVYWLPDSALAEWEAVCKVVEGAAAKANPTAVYMIRHEMDNEAVRAVNDALSVEITDEVKRITTEVLSGELGERALTAREQTLVAIRDKVKDYEGILRVSLAGLEKLIDDAEQARASAALLQSAAQAA